MNDLGITHQSAVDAWECDQMQHLNVRFYGARFAEAEAFAWAGLGLAPRCPVDEDLRFTREIRVGAAIRIESSGDAVEGFVHRLFDGTADSPSATLHTRHGPALQPVPSFSDEGWTPTGKRYLATQHDGAEGPGREALLSLVNHAAVHLGLDRWRNRDDSGRLLTGSALIACRIRHLEVGHCGARLSMSSRVDTCGNSSLRLQHRLQDDASAVTLAEMAVTHVFFDMQTRRPCRVPDPLRNAARSSSACEN